MLGAFVAILLFIFFSHFRRIDVCEFLLGNVHGFSLTIPLAGSNKSSHY
jgi:hypothetical protein